MTHQLPTENATRPLAIESGIVLFPLVKKLHENPTKPTNAHIPAYK